MNVKVKAAGFDFDGTLVVSDALKERLYQDIFKENYGVMVYYKEGKARSREEKIRYFFDTFVKRKPTVREVERISREFGRRYENSLRTCPLFQCTNMVKELRKQVKFTFLLSLENKREVVTLLKHCGLVKYFDEVLGGPKSKVENFRHVLRKHHLKSREVVYVGNSDSDVLSSKTVKVKSVLIKKRFSYNDLRKKLQADFVFSSLCDVPAGILR
ncbi:HAD family hydrolase [Candidatus Woesearchaeota archaeon]|nr:HAD family hydrolase [Candidatus Woesearchaeota archaeon]